MVTAAVEARNSGVPAPHIVVVGSTNTDLVVGVPQIPAPGETVLGGALEMVPGGKGANQAVAAARLGARVTFIARVGDDMFGERALSTLQNDGIRTEFIIPTPGASSGVALIAVRAETGENSIVVAPGANALLSPADVEAAADAFASADAILLSLEVPLETITRAAEIGAARGIPVVLNPAPAQPLPPALLRNVTLLTPNGREARQILGQAERFASDNEFAELLDLGVDAVVTLGAEGAILVNPEDHMEVIPAFPVDAVDTVAAGDCFSGALTVELARGLPLREAVRFANAAAALSVTRRGAQPSLPTRAEVEAFLAARAE